MAVNVSPFGPKPQFLLATGLPAVGNQLFFYVAGSVNTKQNSYTNSTGGVANTNPIVLNALGEPTNEIWFTAGVAYKVVYAPSTDTDPPTSPIWTIDNLYGINDVTVSQSEWVSGPAPTYVGATSFTLAGDQTSTFTPGLRLKFTVTAGTVYGTVYTSVFGALTTVTMAMDSTGNLDSGLSAVQYALLNSVNPSIPSVAQTTIASAATVNLASARGLTVHISGATGPITSFGNAPSGLRRRVIFDAAPTITHNATSLILPGGVSIVAAAGDAAEFESEGAGNWRCASYQKAAFPKVPYTSAGQTITTAGALTLAHSLGAVPTLMQWRLKNTSTELNYAVNDEVVIGDQSDFTNNRGISVVPDATNLNIRFSGDARCFSLPDKTTGAVGGITNAKWQIIFRAWVM